MPDEFDWQTDVEVGWEEYEPVDTKPRPVLSRRLKAIILIGLLCIVAGGAIGLYVTLNRQVRVAEETAESEALIAHSLLTAAILRADFDVEDTLVAPRPSSWHSLQLDLLSRRLFFGRRPLGIEPDRSAGREPVTLSVAQLSPDLTVTEVSDRRSYVVSNSSSLTETVILERSFLYERSGEQWLLIPPADEREYWGNWARDAQEHLVLIYPIRDEEVALRLAQDLEEFINDLCSVDVAACPADFQLEFKLEIDPTSVRRLAEGLYPIRSGSSATSDRLTLPAPTLVGKPIDEAGYQALRRGYASWIGAAIVSGYGLSDEVGVATVVSDVLTEFGLKPPAEPFQPLPHTSLSGFPSGAPKPQQDVLMLCAAQSSLRLLRFQPDSGHWHEEVPSGEQPDIAPLAAGQDVYLSRLPDYQSALIQTAGREEEETVWRTYLWRQGTMRHLTEDERPHYFFPPTMQPPYEPSTDYLAFYAPSTSEAGQQFTGLGLDLESCNTSPCELESLEGMPVWSPDGQRTVVLVSQADDSYMLYLGSARAELQSPIGGGQSVSWLGNNRVAYVAIEATAVVDSLGRRYGERVLIADVEGPDGRSIHSEMLFDGEMIRSALPESIRPPALVIWSAQPAMGGDEWWFISASAPDFSLQQHYILVYNRQTGEARVAADMSHFRHLEPPIVSPGGRYAIILGLSPDGTEASFEMIDALTGEITRLENAFPADWTADESWLLQVDSGKLLLTATETGQHWSIVHDLDGCYWAIWTDKQTGSDQE